MYKIRPPNTPDQRSNHFAGSSRRNFPTPLSCVKSHLNDKPSYCLPLCPQSRHSDLRYFGAGQLSLQPYCLHLSHYITITHSFSTGGLAPGSPHFAFTVQYRGAGTQYTPFILRLQFSTGGLALGTDPQWPSKPKNVATVTKPAKRSISSAAISPAKAIAAENLSFAPFCLSFFFASSKIFIKIFFCSSDNSL